MVNLNSIYTESKQKKNAIANLILSCYFVLFIFPFNMEEEITRTHITMEGNSIDDSENANAVMHTPTAMSKLQSSSGRVLRDLTNLPMKKDLDGSLKRSTSIPPPIDVPCKSKNDSQYSY